MTDATTSALAAQLETMTRMQVAHNVEVHAEWESQGYPYYRAIWVECAELLDHFGWKWWKHQTGDLDQVRLELVDIWHFGLSDLLRGGASQEALVAQLATLSPGSTGAPDPEAFRLAVEALAEQTLLARSFAFEPFLAAMAALPMTQQELFELYVGKNVLNSFRQQNGYKSGTYQKNWGGREDNEHLVELLGELTCAPTEVPTALSAALDSRYRNLTSAGR